MNIWTGLAFLEGAITDPALARDLAGADTPATPAPDPAAPPHPTAAPRQFSPKAFAKRRRNEEPTMNLFKGLLYLLDNDTPASPVLLDAPRPRYGAASAATEFAPELGNRAAAEQWFGPAARATATDSCSLAVGGCR